MKGMIEFRPVAGPCLSAEGLRWQRPPTLEHQEFALVLEAAAEAGEDMPHPDKATGDL